MSDFETMMREYSDLDYALEQEKDLADSYGKSLAEKKKTIEEMQKKSAFLQQKIAQYLLDNGLVEESFGNVVIAPKKLPDVCFVTDEKSIPDCFWEEKTTVKRAISLTKIKQAIKNGEPVPGAGLISNRFAISFKKVKIVE